MAVDSSFVLFGTSKALSNRCPFMLFRWIKCAPGSGTMPFLPKTEMAVYVQVHCRGGRSSLLSVCQIRFFWATLFHSLFKTSKSKVVCLICLDTIWRSDDNFLNRFDRCFGPGSQQSCHDSSLVMIFKETSGSVLSCCFKTRYVWTHCSFCLSSRCKEQTFHSSSWDLSYFKSSNVFGYNEFKSDVDLLARAQP